MKQKFAALALCLTLTACGQSAETEPSSLLGSAAGLDEAEILLCVDGQEIPAWKYLYWLAVDCRRLEAQYVEAGTTLDWEASLPEGGTLEERVKADALADTALCAAVERWAAVYGCTLTEAERAALTPWDDRFLSETQGLAMAETSRQYGRLYKLYLTDGSPLAPAEGELALFAETSGFLAADRLLIPTGSDREAARQEAAGLFAQLNESQEPGTVFDSLLTTYGSADPASDWDEALRAAVSALETGQLSGIIETDEGFSILRRLPADTATLRENHFDSLLQTAADSSEIQCCDAFEALRPASFWAALKATGGAGAS